MYYKTFFLSIILFLLFSNVYSQLSDFTIVPSPKIIISQPGKLTFSANGLIIVKGINPHSNQFAASELQNTLKEFQKVNMNISYDNSTQQNPINTTIIIEQSDTTKFHNQNKNINNPLFISEGYTIKVFDHQIIITSASNKGIFYGVTSLIQLIEKAANRTIPYFSIIDYPDMKVRGITDDISRGQVSNLDNFKKIIRNISRYKMNTYMPYIEDVIQLDSFPTIGIKRGSLTKNEIKELIDYADKYYVEIIPIFQTLGHFDNILSQDEFLTFAEFPGSASLNVSSDTTYIFLEKMLRQVFKLFPSKYIHIGADESYDVGLGNSQYLVKKSDIAMVHLNHYRKVYNICKKYNRQVMMYSDILLDHPEIIDSLPKDIIIVDWHYNSTLDYKSVKTFNRAGLTYIVSPTVWNFTTPYPVHTLSLPNIKYLTASGIKNNSLGMLNSNWGDYGAETFKELIWFGYAWSAVCAWNIEKSDITSFANNYFYDFFGINDKRLNIIFQYLSSPLNQFTWHDLWRHPLLPLRNNASWTTNMSPASRIMWMDWTLPYTSEYLNELENKVTRNKDQIQLLKYIVSLDNYYKLKLETQSLLTEELQDNSENNDKKSIELIDNNITQLTTLKSDYNKLWLEYYKPDNLNFINDKFNRLISYFNETKEQIINKKIESPLIKSKWIYKKLKHGKFATEATFYKEFNVKDKPDSVRLQLIGDTYAKLYINDSLVSNVYARKCLSLIVDYKKIKYIDITSYIKPDTINTFEVKVQNFNEKGAAGFNLIAKFYNKGTDYTINSDETWICKNSETKWKYASSKEYPSPVIEPNFKNGRTSWIER